MLSPLAFFRKSVTQRIKIFITSITFVVVFIFLFGGIFLFVNSYEWQDQKRELLNSSIESVETWQDAEELFGDYRLVGSNGKILINRGVFEFLPNNIGASQEYIELEGMHFFVISKVLKNGSTIYFVDDITDAIELRGITTKSLLLSGLILIIFVWLSAWFFTEKIFKPIRLIIRSMEDFSLDSSSSEGDIIPIYGSDSDEFVTLARNLESFYARIRIEWKRREDLSNNIAHELRNGLFEIGSTLELAEATLENEKKGIIPKAKRKTGEERLRDARNEVSHLSKLTEGLLLLGNGQKEIVKKATNIRNIILKNLPIDQDQWMFEVVCNDATLWNISEPLFEIVLKNIIGNAVKFNKPGEKILITADKSSIEIVDHGCWIDKKDLPYVFDVFYTGSRSRTRGSWHGIWLALAKRICNLHGFSINIVSSAENGTSVKIEHPTSSKNESL